MNIVVTARRVRFGLCVCLLVILDFWFITLFFFSVPIGSGLNRLKLELFISKVNDRKILIGEKIIFQPSPQ